MNALYSKGQLEGKKLIELKAIALQFNAIAKDKRSKESWVEAIIATQPHPVKSVEPPTPTCADCPHFQAHNDGTDKGWCCLFDRFARDRHQLTQDCINSFKEDVEQVDDYLFHEEVVQPANLPVVGQTHFVGDRLLRCIEICGEYAAVWDIIDNGVTMGEISMSWDCFWSHTLSFKSFATPQEAIADLCESASELVEKPEFEVYPTERESVFTVTSRKSGKNYQVYLESNYCTCPHWFNRHGQPGFRDKHIDAVKNFLQSYSGEQLCHQLQ